MKYVSTVNGVERIYNVSYDAVLAIAMEIEMLSNGILFA